MRPISPGRLQGLMRADHDQQPLLLDLRSPEAYAACHLPGAQNIPLADLAELVSELPQNRRLVVCCDCDCPERCPERVLRASGHPWVRRLGWG